MEHDVTVLPQSFMDWLCLKPRVILVKGVGRVHIAQTNLNGPAFNPLWSDAPGRWQVDGKVGDMNETLARAVALGAEMPVEVMAADAPDGLPFVVEYWLARLERWFVGPRRLGMAAPQPPAGWTIVSLDGGSRLFLEVADERPLVQEAVADFNKRWSRLWR